MPTTTQELRDKFMKDGDDGIDAAEQIIISHGGTVNITSIGIIKIPAHMQWDEDGNNYDIPYMEEFWDAVQFLCEEWDYAIL